MSIKRLFDAVERRGDIGRRVTALVLPISNRPRVTSGCAGKIGLREAGEHTSGPNLASRDNVAHNPRTLYTNPLAMSAWLQLGLVPGTQNMMLHAKINGGFPQVSRLDIGIRKIRSSPRL